MSFIINILVSIISLSIIVLLARELELFDKQDIDKTLLFIIETAFVILLTIILCMALNFLFG